MNKVLFFIFLFFISCNIVSSKQELQQNEDSNQSDCIIPKEILDYLYLHPDEFKLIHLDEELDIIKNDISDGICPTICFGDFNQNGKEDAGIILKYKKYKNEDHPNYVFPFLVIFNDYKEQLDPIVIYKTGDYKEEPIKTVVYDQFENKLFSYIKKGEVCNKEVIDIVIPEKSSFFVYWNAQKSQYEYLNYLDDNICDRVSKIEIDTHWFGHYTLSMDYGKLDEFSSMFISYDIVINQDSCIFSGVGYQTYFTYLCRVQENKDELYLIYLNTIDGDGFTNHSDMGTIATIIKSGQQYYIESTIIADKNWEYNKKILLDKIKE